MACMKKVFEHLPLWWMGIWMHIYTITATNIAPDLGELAEAEVLSDIWVQMMSLCYRCGCITFQTATHFHVIHKEGV